MNPKSPEEKLYDENFNLYYNSFKFASLDDQKPLLIGFFKHLLSGYEKGYLSVKDVGGWCTSTALGAEVGSNREGTFYGDLIRLGYRYGDSFDIGEKEVKEVWGTSWEEAEKIFIERFKNFINKYSS